MDFDKVMESLDTASFEQLEAIKAKATELISARKDEKKKAEKLQKEAEKAAKAEHGKELKDSGELDVDRFVVFTMKGEVRISKILKTTDKTVTVQLDEGKRFIQLRFVLGAADTLEVAEEIAAENAKGARKAA